MTIYPICVITLTTYWKHTHLKFLPLFALRPNINKQSLVQSLMNWTSGLPGSFFSQWLNSWGHDEDMLAESMIKSGDRQTQLFSMIREIYLSWWNWNQHKTETYFSMKQQKKEQLPFTRIWTRCYPRKLAPGEANSIHMMGIT